MLESLLGLVRIQELAHVLRTGLDRVVIVHRRDRLTHALLAPSRLQDRAHVMGEYHDFDCAPQGRTGKKRLRPAVKRAMVVEVMTTHDLSQRRACGLIGITRRGLKRAPVEDRNRGLRQRLRELAEARRRWGCPLLYLMLRREGWRANHKRVERVYREEGLSLRRRRRRKRLSHLRVARERPVAVNQTWAVDFIHDSLISGRHFRAFAVLDEWSRESLAIEVDVSLTGERVTRVLERLRTTRGLPLVIQADNGPELRCRVLDQ
jgi:putative transposase